MEMWAQMNIVIAVEIIALMAFIHENVAHPLKDAPMTGGKIKETPLDGGRTIYHAKMTQPEALMYCEGKGGRLAVLPTLEDAEKLVTSIYDKSEIPAIGEDLKMMEPKRDLGLSRRYWIGLSDVIKEEYWIWLRDGKELAYDEMWARGQPDHVQAHGKDKNEHCVSLWNPNFDKVEDNKHSKHTFNDENCSRKYYFICESASG